MDRRWQAPLSFVKKWKLPLFAVVALVFTGTTVWRKPEPLMPLHTPPPVAPYDHSVAGVGVIEPCSETLNLGSDLPGIVRRVFVQTGQVIPQGAPLFELDRRDNQAELHVARITCLDAQAHFDLAKRIKDSPALSRDEWQQRQFNLDFARAKVKEAEAALARAEVTGERLMVRAPLAGHVLEINVHEGEYVASGPYAQGMEDTPGLTDPPVRMGDLTRLQVRVEVDEENSPRVSAQAPARGFLRGDAQRAIPLTFVGFEYFVSPKQNVSALGQRVDTRVLRIIYALPPDHKNIFVGQQMDVFIDAHA